MTKKKYEEKLHLDMPFAEALERFVGVEPKEMHANIAKTKRTKKRKPPSDTTRGGKLASPGGQAENQNLTNKVIRLRDHRTR